MIFTPKTNDGSYLLKLKIKDAEKDDSIRSIASTYIMHDNVIRDGYNNKGKKVITFSNIFPLIDDGNYYCKWETDLPFKINVTILGANENSKNLSEFQEKSRKGLAANYYEFGQSQTGFEAAIKQANRAV